MTMMGIVINWFLLLIIFVFDPLAIALVVAANFAFDQINTNDEDSTEEYFRHRNNMVTAYTQAAAIAEQEVTNEIPKEETVDEKVEEDPSNTKPEKEDIYKEKSKSPARSSGYWF